MGVMATSLMREMYNADKEGNDRNDYEMTVLVTGYQFYWEYKILGKDGASDIKIVSKLDKKSDDASKDEDIEPLNVPNYMLNVTEPLVIPIKKKIRYVLTSADVIHSWWVPDFGWKKDANPGYTNEAWARVEDAPWMNTDDSDIDKCTTTPKEQWTDADKQICSSVKSWADIDKSAWVNSKNPVGEDFWKSVKVAGVYRGQCTELCGVGHGYMPVVVVALKQADYDKWVQIKQNGSTVPPKPPCDAGVNSCDDREALLLKGNQVYMEECSSCHGRNGEGNGAPALNGSSKVAGDTSALAQFILNKVPMANIAKNLDDPELAGVVTYIADRFGNQKEALISPRAIQEIRAGGGNAAPTSTDKSTDEKDEIAADVDVSAKLTLEELVSKGEVVYGKECVGCHQATGEGMPPMFPALTGSAVATGEIDAQVNLMLNGKNSMPAFGKSLNAVDFAAVLAYTRNKLGNSAGDFKQPADIQALIAALPADAE
jgi:cytochrome c oxidase subunit II